MCFSLLGCAACAAVSYAPDAADQKGKAFAPLPDKALIYVYRRGSIGFILVSHVLLDGALAGSNGIKTYLVLEVEPGRHVVSSSTLESALMVELEVAAGHLYFIEQRIYGGWFTRRISLEQKMEDEGKAEVRKCKRLLTILPGP